MDFQKNGFWIVVGAIAALEVAFLGYAMFVMEGGIDKAATNLKRHQTKLKKAAGEPFIPNKKDSTEMDSRLAKTVQELTRTVVYLAARDAMALERRFVEGGSPIEEPSQLRPYLQSAEAKLRGEMEEGKGPYANVQITTVTDLGGEERFPVAFPELAGESEDEVKRFYRSWWVMRLALDVVAKAAGDAAKGRKSEDERWQLMRLEVGTGPGRGPAGKPYVKDILPVEIELKMQVSDLQKLLQRAYNTGLMVMPKAVQVNMQERDPDLIVIPLEPNEPEPTPEQLRKKASSKRPMVFVKIALDVFDLDRESLLNIARVHRAKIGNREQVEAFLKTLDTDDFIKAQPGFDRKKFLDTMVNELMQEAPK